MQQTPNISQCLSFPLLPLPPQEHYYYGHENLQTEDKMGTLHNAIINTKQHLRPSSSSSDRDRGTAHRPTPSQTPTVRFVPRTTHLENRKRKMEEDGKNTLTDVLGKNEPLIGPKLPEPPKLNMEDVSLNTTVSLIRNTMKQVTYICFVCVKLEQN